MMRQAFIAPVFLDAAFGCGPELTNQFTE